MAFRRLLCVSVLAVLSADCQALGIVKQYEYDEHVQLALDGSAVVDVSTSVPALVALRGADLDVDPEARLDRRALARLYDAPGVILREVNTYRRRGRRFVHVRLEVSDIAALSQAAPLAWSRYRLNRLDGEFQFVQDVGRAAGRNVGDVGWDGDELIAFRLHLPSRITFHNADEFERGNILAWEQSLRDRLSGEPLHMEARMESESILYQTLWLFGGTFASAMAALAAVIWWVSRKGRSVVPA